MPVTHVVHFNLSKNITIIFCDMSSAILPPLFIYFSAYDNYDPSPAELYANVVMQRI